MVEFLHDELSAFFTSDMLTCHRRKSTGEDMSVVKVLCAQLRFTDNAMTHDCKLNGSVWLRAFISTALVRLGRIQFRKFTSSMLALEKLGSKP